MKQITIKVQKLLPEARLPSYSHRGEFGDLASDLYSAVSIELMPREVKTISTGIAMEFPAGFGGLVADRSGLALKGFTTLAGVVDPGYRGEIKVVAANVGTCAVQINPGDRIAQIIILERIDASFLEAEELQETERGQSGFGSTGI